MANLKEPLDAATGQQIDAVLQRLRDSQDVGADLLRVVDIAIGITHATWVRCSDSTKKPTA